MSVCLYICMYVCMSVCLYVCLHVCMSVSLYVCMSACMYVCVCMSVSVCLHVRASVCLHVCMRLAVLSFWTRRLLRDFCTVTGRNRFFHAAPAKKVKRKSPFLREAEKATHRASGLNSVVKMGVPLPPYRENGGTLPPLP